MRECYSIGGQGSIARTSLKIRVLSGFAGDKVATAKNERQSEYDKALEPQRQQLHDREDWIAPYLSRIASICGILSGRRDPLPMMTKMKAASSIVAAD